MQATTDPKQPVNQQENAVIFIDYSSVLIEGQKTYPDWHIDVGVLYEILLRQFVDDKYVTIRLYKPTPPSIDTIWDAAEVDIESVPERETWARNETDSEIIADLVSIGADAYYRQIPTTLIIVLGDRHLPVSLEKIKKYCCQLDIWLWKSALPHVWPEVERKGLARVHTLDDVVNSDTACSLEIPEDEPMDRADWGDNGSNSNEANNDYVEAPQHEGYRRMRCYWRGYCSYGLACYYIHTEEEKEGFKACRSRKVEKYRFCRNRECDRGSRCSFAHSEAELFCPTCNESGVGHEMQRCPKRFATQ